MVGTFMSLLSMNNNRIAKEMLYGELATVQRPLNGPFCPTLQKCLQARSETCGTDPTHLETATSNLAIRRPIVKTSIM